MNNTTPVLGNGIFMRDTNYKIGSHLDSYHLRSQLLNSEPTDMGPVDIWAQQQKVEMPLYQMASFGGKNTIMVDNAKGEWKWQTPLSDDLPYVIEDLDPTNTTKGADEEPFKIKLNTREFGLGDIITYDKYTGTELYIDPSYAILPVSDGVIYTVTIVNNGTGSHLDNTFLANGTEFFRKASARGEFGEKFAEIQSKSGYREYYNFVGGAEAHSGYSISSRADLMIQGGLTADGAMPVTEIWKCHDESLTKDGSVTDIKSLAAQMGKTKFGKAQENGQISRSFLTQMEAAHVSKVSRDIETYLMWGHGGRVRQDGPDDIRLSVGLWKQLDNSFKKIYNKNSFSLDLFKSEIYNFYVGKVEFDGPNSGRKLIVQTGLAGMKAVNEAIAQEASNSGLITNASDIGAITGSGMDLNFGFAYTSYEIPFLANIKFVINPAFDNVNNNDIENPRIDGFTLSSYSYVIFDVTDEGSDNIFLLKLKWDNQLKWWYQNGTMDYMGRRQGFQSSGDFNGYKVKMSQTMPALWVKDPTKVLKIVMRNPITGGSL